MGSDRGVCGRPKRRLKAAVVLALLAGALFAAPNALAGLFTVNSAGDEAGTCPFDCTLRAAIDAANVADPGSTITFGIGIGGSYTITPASPLPQITKAMTIDATTQPGYVGAPLIKLNGSVAGVGKVGFDAFAPVTVRGFSIVNFSGGQGIELEGGSTGSLVAGNYVGLDSGGSVAQPNGIGIGVYSSDDTIGGTTAADRNVISGNQHDGIQIAFANGNIVSGNYIGTDASGNVARANQNGVEAESDNNVIGQAGGRNVISGNSNVGVFIDGASNNHVKGNYIGTNADGDASVPNANAGVQILAGNTPASSNEVGAGNVVSGNDGPGILINSIQPGAASGNTVLGSLIGTAADGKTPLGNTGPGVFFAPGGNAGGNVVGADIAGSDENTIAYNAKGIVVANGNVHNRTAINSIHDNSGPGIDLNDDGPTPNDTDDADAGANDLLNTPVLANASRDASGHVHVDVSYDGAPGAQQYILNFYASPSCDGTGFGEGATWLGSRSEISASVTGDFSDSAVPLGYAAPGSSITATATDSLGNTSEFSHCASLPTAPTGQVFTVNTAADHDDGTCDLNDCTLREAIKAANGLPGTDTIAFGIPCCALTINITSPALPLPAITDDVIIDGTTQPGVQLDGSGVSTGTIGLDVEGGVNGSTIRGLSITNFPGGAIELNGPGSVVLGNKIGVLPDGSSFGGNGAQGIVVYTGGNQIGGTGSGEGNVIANTPGVGIQDSATGPTTIVGNRIGTNAAGTAAAPNTQGGIRLNGTHGTQTIIDNLISGNGPIADGILADRKSTRLNSSHSH